MPTWESLAEFARELKGLEIDLTQDEIKTITRQMGREGQQIADRQAARSLGGDRAFSGWNRGAPVPLATHLKPARQGTLLLPKFPGGWTVAEQGRNQGNAGGFSGPGINRSTGITSRTKSGAVRRVRARQSRRWNGATAGKGTASRAVAEMDRQLPRIADKAVLKVTRKRFTVT
jgi:hypothetical protein